MENEEKAPYKMIQTIGLSVGAAVAYIIVVLGLMFYCKKRRNSKRLQKNTEGEEAEMEGLNGECRNARLNLQSACASYCPPLTIWGIACLAPQAHSCHSICCQHCQLLSTVTAFRSGNHLFLFSCCPCKSWLYAEMHISHSLTPTSHLLWG